MNYIPKRRVIRLLPMCALLFTLVLAACDLAPAAESRLPDATVEPATPTAETQILAPGTVDRAPTATTEVQTSTPGSEAVDAAAVASPTTGDDAPAPTEVTATGTGAEMTALQ